MFGKLFAFIALPVLASAGTIVQSGTLVGFSTRLIRPLDHFVSGYTLTHVEATFHLTYGSYFSYMFPDEPGTQLVPPARIVAAVDGRIQSLINGSVTLRSDQQCEFEIQEAIAGEVYCGGQADFVVVGDPAWPYWSTYVDPLPFGITYGEVTASCEAGGVDGFCLIDPEMGVMVPPPVAEYTLTYTYADQSIPEPGSASLALLSGAFLAVRAWRRHSGRLRD